MSLLGERVPEVMKKDGPEATGPGNPPLAMTSTGGQSRLRALASSTRMHRFLSIPALMPYVLLAIFIALLASQQTDTLSLSELNITAAETLALVLVAAGQTIVILSGGIDLSVGGIVSFTTVVAATEMGTGGSTSAIRMVGFVLAGLVIGAINGIIIVRTRMQPFIVTLATWSIWSGVSLLILSTDGGTVPSFWLNFGNATFHGVAVEVWIVVALIVFWMIFVRTRLGIDIRSVGSSTEAAYLAGIRVGWTLIATYALSGMFAALAGLFLITQTVSGSPTIGNDFILPSVVAVVLGGASLAGGRAGMAGAIAGAFILTLVGDVIFAFGISAGWHFVAEGLLLVVAVLVNTYVGGLFRRGASHR
jgi:ribose transport system permease protein